MTLDRNGHLFDDELDAVADRIDAAARVRGLFADSARIRDHRATRPIG
jgi:hypothetical protein